MAKSPFDIPLVTLGSSEPKAKKRREFTIKKKKMEWMRASNRDPFSAFVKTSQCRECGRLLRWGDGSYDFDHRDNNSANVSQKNCYLVCKVCHGKHTKFGKKRRVKNKYTGATIGYKTIMKKTGYKKTRSKKHKSRRRKKQTNKPAPFGLSLGEPIRW